MNKRTGSKLPWFKFWTGEFRAKTDHLSNAEVGAYIRLLASYWDNVGLPLNERALSRIAKIEAGDRVDLGALLSEFFIERDGVIYNEDLDALQTDAIGEEDAKKRRTLAARIALAKSRLSVTTPATDTEVEVEVDLEGEEDLHQDGITREEIEIQTEDRDERSDVNENTEPRRTLAVSGDKRPENPVPTSVHQSASLKLDGEAQGGAEPAVSSARLPDSRTSAVASAKSAQAEQARKLAEDREKRPWLYMTSEQFSEMQRSKAGEVAA